MVPLTLIHFSDLHVWRFGLDRDLFPKRLLGLGNLFLRRRHKFPATVAEEFVQQILTEEANFVCFSGDLTTTGLRAEFEAGTQLLKPVKERWGEQFHAIPGNHDRYTPRAASSRHFETIFHPDRPAMPYAWELAGKWTLVAFETTRPRLISSRGEVTAATRDALRELLAKLRAEGREIVTMGHYPLALPPGVADPWEHALPGAEPVARILERAGVALYLHGHKHRRWRFERNGVTYLNSGSAGQLSADAEKGPGYTRVVLGEQGVMQVQAVRLVGSGPGDWRWESCDLPAEKAMP